MACMVMAYKANIVMACIVMPYKTNIVMACIVEATSGAVCGRRRARHPASLQTPRIFFI